MRLVRNAGSDRVVDLLRKQVVPGSVLGLMSAELSLFGFDDLPPFAVPVIRQESGVEGY
jgi:hypothetical protein